MPEIDSDLFQVLTLALLFLTLLALLAALSVLSGIKKQLESGGASGVTPAPARSEYQAPATSAYEPTTSSDPVSAYEAAPSYSTPRAEPAQEISTGFVPIAEATPATATQQVSATTPSTALRGDEPEEQPFERDGRWWFKRGGELLVYDEGTGQWVAPSAGSGMPVSAAGASVSSATTAVEPRAEAGEGWKCSSCGAVNGSTATSCRMCFAPR